MGSINEFSLSLPRSLTTGKWRVVVIPFEDKATEGDKLISKSAWFWLNEDPNVALIEPFAESVFVGGKEMTLKWTGSIPTNGGMGVKIKSRECDKEIWSSQLTVKESLLGQLDVVLPHMSIAMWVTVEVVGGGVQVRRTEDGAKRTSGEVKGRYNN